MGMELLAFNHSVPTLRPDFPPDATCFDHSEETAAPRTASRRISIQALVQRLALLAELELPCTICLGSSRGDDHCCRGAIRLCSLEDGRLNLLGDDFSLHLCEEHIESVHLVHRRRSSEPETAVEIISTSGALLARLLGTADPLRAGVWQDIMDSFAFASA